MSSTRPQTQTPPRRTELLLAGALLLLAGTLRMGWPAATEFKADEARLYALALDAATGAGLPLRGIGTSVGFPNFPLSVWLYALPLWVWPHPYSAVLFTGALNTLAVAACWWLARRVWGAEAALLAALLYAASPWAIIYSRKLWAQNLLPLFVMGWAASGLLAFSAPLFYRGYAKSICTSINHVVCHGIPGDKFLNEGDIVNVDITSILDGYYGDTSKTFSVGNISVKAEKLIKVTYESMMEGIKILKPGITLGDIGFAIQSYAESHGCSVVRDFCGHGIGKTFHEEPNILHYGKKDEGMKLKKGMVFTIEPMINLGEYHTKVLQDGWTAVTKDKSLSAQFEHTVGIVDNGYVIFTL